MIDEVLVSVMKNPKSYTGEDVVEINCHGGILLMQIFTVLLNNSCFFNLNDHLIFFTFLVFLSQDGRSKKYLNALFIR